MPKGVRNEAGRSAGPGHTSSRRDTPRPAPLPPRPRPRPHANARFGKERRIPGGRAEGKPPRPAPLGRAPPGAPSLTDAPTSVARTDRGLGLRIPRVRGRGHTCVRRGTLPSMPTAPCLFVLYFYVETFRASGTRTRLTTEGSLLLRWAGFSLFRAVQTTTACPTETRPNRRSRGEPSCCGAGAGPGGGSSRTSRRAVGPPTPPHHRRAARLP